MYPNPLQFAQVIRDGVPRIAMNVEELDRLGAEYLRVHTNFTAAVAAQPEVAEAQLAHPRVNAALRQLAREEARRDRKENPLPVTPVINPMSVRAVPELEYREVKLLRPASLVWGFVLGLVAGFFLWHFIDPTVNRVLAGLASGLVLGGIAAFLFPRKESEAHVKGMKIEFLDPSIPIPTVPVGALPLRITSGV